MNRSDGGERPAGIVEERSLPNLFTELTQEAVALLRQEAELARAEISRKTSQAVAGVAAIAVGGVLAAAGFLVLLNAAVEALAQVWPPWLAALVVGMSVALVGAVFLAVGRKKIRMEHLVPTRTVETIRDDRNFAKERFQ